MELWDVYDENRIKTGRTLERGKPEKVQKGEYRMVVHVCIFNSKGEMLIQQRQPFKRSWSGKWDLTVGGSAVSGDTSVSAAVREASEEVGVTLAPDELRRVLTIQTELVFDDIYVAQKDLDETALKLQYEEVEQVKWASADEIKAMIREKIFIPYHESLIDLIFFIRNHDGTRTEQDKMEQ